MTPLTTTQMDSLQTKLNSGDVAGFYDDLDSYGDPYGRLGAGVTRNDTWQGQLANGFLESQANADGIDMSYGSPAWDALNKELARRYLDEYRADNGAQPTRKEIQDFHNNEYVKSGVNKNGWFPNELLDNVSDPDAIWDDYQNNENISDLFEDLRDVIPQAMNPDSDFGRNFGNAIGGMDGQGWSDLLSDLWDGGLDDFFNGLLWGPLLGPIMPFFKDMPMFTISPLVFDLDGDGVELTELGIYNTYFDLRGNGQAVLTG